MLIIDAASLAGFRFISKKPSPNFWLQEANWDRLSLSVIIVIMLCQYFLISRGRFEIQDMFTTNREYWYSGGWNYRVYVAYVVGIAPNFYGFLVVFGVKIT